MAAVGSSRSAHHSKPIASVENRNKKRFSEAQELMRSIVKDERSPRSRLTKETKRAFISFVETIKTS